MPQINVDHIKEQHRRRGWTQEDAADAIGISREQFGKHLRSGKTEIEVNGKTAEGYARAFGCSVEELGQPPKVEGDLPEGMRMVRVPMDHSEVLQLEFASLRYNTEPHIILRMAAATFAYAAEANLKERRDKLQSVKGAVQDLWESEDLMLNGARASAGELTEEISKEMASIEAMDLPGEMIRHPEDRSFRAKGMGHFAAFLSRSISAWAPDILEGESDADLDRIFEDQIAEVCGGDRVARFALLRGDVSLQDALEVPESERVSFLRRRCSPETQAEIKKHDERLAAFRKILDGYEAELGGDEDD